MALVLRGMTRLAGSPQLDRLGLRPRLERAVFHLTRTGAVAAASASRTFTAATKLTAPERLPNAPRTDLYDLTPTDEQAMLVEVCASSPPSGSARRPRTPTGPAGRRTS